MGKIITLTTHEIKTYMHGLMEEIYLIFMDENIGNLKRAREFTLSQTLSQNTSILVNITVGKSGEKSKIIDESVHKITEALLKTFLAEIEFLGDTKRFFWIHLKNECQKRALIKLQETLLNKNKVTEETVEVVQVEIAPPVNNEPVVWPKYGDTNIVWPKVQT